MTDAPCGGQTWAQDSERPAAATPPHTHPSSRFPGSGWCRSPQATRRGSGGRLHFSRETTLGTCQAPCTLLAAHSFGITHCSFPPPTCSLCRAGVFGAAVLAPNTDVERDSMGRVAGSRLIPAFRRLSEDTGRMNKQLCRKGQSCRLPAVNEAVLGRGRTARRL